MKKRHLILTSASLAVALAFLPSKSHAAIGMGVLPQAATRLAADSAIRCNANLAPAAGASYIVSHHTGLDKASALLGGQRSRLAQITQQQTGGAADLVGSTQPSRLSGISAAGPASAFCSQFVMPSPAAPVTAPGLAGNLPEGEFLASRRLPVRRTPFDSAWTRVQRQALPSGMVAGLSRVTAGVATPATVAAVNSWTNGHVRYIEDRDLYGKADYWAGAASTLKRGAGDCEDIAIVKLQLLAALGIPRDDMFLTVARDLVRNNDHAVLIVKLSGRIWLLDNSTNELLDATSSNDYRPIMSFGTTGKWLHGYPQL